MFPPEFLTNVDLKDLQKGNEVFLISKKWGFLLQGIFLSLSDTDKVAKVKITSTHVTDENAQTLLGSDIKPNNSEYKEKEVHIFGESEVFAYIFKS